jgi:lipoprotein-anchoring transpeptidase ErfK/SrfK
MAGLGGLTGCASVPELGRLTDRGGGKRKIVISLGEQRAYLYRDGKVAAVSRISSGKPGHRTPTGSFRVSQKNADHRSSIYGAYVKNGKVLKPDVDNRKDPRPSGAKFVGAPMPYFMRFNGAIGMHSGHVPKYPASHGCVRLPRRHANRFYHAAELGTPVIVKR